MVFNGALGAWHLSAHVDDAGVSSLVLTKNGDTLAVTAQPSGTMDLAYNGITAQEAENAFILPDGRTIALIARKQRCGGSNGALTDTEGNIILTFSSWLGAMCVGTTLKTVEDRVLTECLDEYSIEGDISVKNSKITLPDGRITTTVARKQIPDYGE